MNSLIKISIYNSQYQAQVVELILKIQQKEFDVAINFMKRMIL